MMKVMSYNTLFGGFDGNHFASGLSDAGTTPLC